MRWIRSVVVIALLAGCPLLAVSTPAAESAAPDPKAGPYAGLEYRLIGPAAGGRVSRVVGIPGDPSVYWAATAAGGVWRSVNGGVDWSPVFDEQPVSSIGSIAVAPSDPNVIWVGSGEANIRGNVGEGNGLYRSVDGGKSWRHVWEAEAQIGTMIVHPEDPDVAFAAVLGSPFGPGEERGVYRTTDGGGSWQRVLFVDPETGASDVCFDPSNPRVLFAGTWQVRRQPWKLTSGGPGSGLWSSRDGGESWKRLTGEGLPEGIWGKVGVRVAPSDPQRVYALIEAEEGGLFRSDDGGESWRRESASRGVQQRAWYYSTLTVDPTRADVVWFPQVAFLKTIDGGETLRSVAGGGWDYHDVWIDPADPARMVVGSDAGVSLSTDGGESWTRPALPISQFYKVAVDTREPYRVMGSVQDLGTVSGPSRTLHGGGIFLSDWHSVGGGEAGHVAPDPSDPDTVWAGEYLGFLSRWNGRTRQAPHMGIYPENGSGRPPAELRHRFQWTAPILVSPHDPKTVYHAAEQLFRTRDGGQSWEAVSPDLTRDDESKQGWSGGPITGDITGVETYDTIFALAESPLVPGLLWVGTDDGLVHVSRNGGESWTNATPRDLPEWATVAIVEPSHFEPGTAYVVVDAHRLDDEHPYLWKTEDFGASWRRLDRGLDPEVYLHVVREDPKHRGLLYLGTERGVLVSRDDGAHWESLRLNLPTVAIADLEVAGDDLVVATIGRSAWILDDLTPVREMSEAIRSSSAHLFPPLPTARWHTLGRWSAPLGSRDGAGENPPEGAVLTYWLAAKPEGPIRLEVLDAAGEVIRTLASELAPQYTTPDQADWTPGAEPKPDLTAEPGLQRTAWDLAYEDARWVQGTRIDTYGPGPGPKVVPGEYTLRLVVGEERFEQTVEVGPDPRSTADPEDLSAQVAFELELRDRMSRIADLVGQIRDVREQLQDRIARFADREDAADLVAQGRRLVAALDAIEDELHNPHAEVEYDVLAGRHGGAKLYPRYGWLAGGALDHDGPPTQGMREIAAELGGELAGHEAELGRIFGEELSELDARAAELGLPFVAPPGK